MRYRAITPIGVVTQNYVLLSWGLFRGICPHPQGTEFLDFQPLSCKVCTNTLRQGPAER